MRSTPLHARTSLPSRVAVMLRTTPPPEGIGQISIFCLCGSKRASVRAHAGFAVPNHVADRSDAVRAGAGAARRRPVACAARLRIEAPEKAACKVGVPDRTVGRDGDAPWPAGRVRQWIFADRHRLRVDARNLVGAELGEIGNSVRIHGDPIGQRVFGRHVNDLYFARPRHQPADRVRPDHSEPEVSAPVEYRRVWVVSVVGQPIFADRAGVRIELADIAGETGGEPDVAVLVGDETVRPGVRNARVIFLEHSGFGIEPPERARHLPSVPDRAVGRRQRIVRMRAFRRHGPFREGDGDLRQRHRQSISGQDRKTKQQKRGDHRE